MNTLKQAVHDYVNLRRSLGFKLSDAERCLTQFVMYLEQHKQSYITEAWAVKWAQLPGETKPAWAVARLGMVREFARYRQIADPRTEIPAFHVLSAKRSRPKPYLYTEEEVCILMQSAQNMPCRTRHDALRPWTYYCLIGLLCVTGMRPGEACGLKLKDVDLNRALITVHAEKYDRTRLVPIHESTCTALEEYIQRRAQYWCGHPVAEQLFVTRNGTRLSKGLVQDTFRALTIQSGLRKTHDSHGPRLQDFRHRFAVRALENCYRSDADPEKILPVLSAYLGHVRIGNTYWYLESNPGLMSQAMRKLERRWEGVL